VGQLGRLYRFHRKKKKKSTNSERGGVAIATGGKKCVQVEPKGCGGDRGWKGETDGPAGNPGKRDEGG